IHQAWRAGPAARRWRHNAGSRTGSIMAAIMASHMAANDRAAPGQVWPGSGSHMVQARRSPQNGSASNMAIVRGARLFGPRVLVVPAPPDAGLVASFGGAVQPLVHAPQPVEPARVGRIGVVDDAVFHHERAHARPVAVVGGPVGAAHGGHQVFRLDAAAFLAGTPFEAHIAVVVVFDVAGALLRLGEPDVEIRIEIA